MASETFAGPGSIMREGSSTAGVASPQPATEAPARTPAKIAERTAPPVKAAAAASPQKGQLDSSTRM